MDTTLTLLTGDQIPADLTCEPTTGRLRYNLTLDARPAAFTLSTGPDGDVIVQAGTIRSGRRGRVNDPHMYEHRPRLGEEEVYGPLFLWRLYHPGTCARRIARPSDHPEMAALITALREDYRARLLA